MRHSYTPIFKDILTSRVWALPDAHLRVWLWLSVNADPEGFVCADLAGVAVAARVSAQDARDALDVLALPDADADPSDPFEGRIIERVPRGWRVLGVEAKLELAKHEAKKARQRRYMKATRELRAEVANDIAAIDAHVKLTSEPVELPVDASKSKSTSKSTSPSEDGGDLPLPPQSLSPTSGYTVSVAPKIVAELPADWAPSDELRSRAKMEGVQELDGHIARLRLGPIGGTRGVFSHQLDAYIGNMLGKMRMWEEADRAKAGGRSDPFKAAPPEGGVRGFPAWVRKNHVEYLAGDRKTLKLFAQRFAKEHHIPPSVLLPNDAATAFTAFLREVIATPGEAA